jgi:hypothetical protein
MMMNRIKILLQRIQYYPLLVGTFPIIALYNHNIQHVFITDIFRILIIVLATIFFFLVVLGIFIEDQQKPALYISLFVILFFSYGHIYNFIGQFSPEFHHLMLFLGWIFLLILGIRLISRLENTKEITSFIIIVTSALLVYQGFLATRFEINRMILNRSNPKKEVGLLEDLLIEELPDIYFIVLDAHTSSAVLLEEFGYDNSSEMKKLQSMGFYLAECSQANYWRTEYSLSSTLNLNYLDEFLENPSQLPDYEYSYTLQFLDNLGYQMIKFETNADHNIAFGEDIYLERERNIWNMFNVFPFTRMNAYEVELIHSTWLQPIPSLLSNINGLLPADWILDVKTSLYFDNFNQVFFMLRELSKVPLMDVEGPKFVYAHFLVPHEPYIFHPSGKYEHHTSDDDYINGYGNNAEFIDSQLPDLLEKIISRSKSPPIIIVMGDHGRNGSPPKELLPILNLYYLPNGGNELLYPSISPVNTFRVILNTYFNTDFELLEDISYYGKTEEFKNYTIYGNFCEVEEQ